MLGFDGVITSCDYYLPTVARIAGHLGLPGPGPEAVENACRKDATRRVLADAGVPGPRFAVREEWADIAARPRGRSATRWSSSPSTCAPGCTSAAWTTRPNSPTPVRALADFPVNARGQRRAPAVLLEELLDGPEVSVETVSYAGAVARGRRDRQEHRRGARLHRDRPHVPRRPRPAADTEAAEQTALGALKALGLTDGVVAHTEIKLTPAGPRVVEVNPRPAGNRITELVRHVTGIDLAAACVDVALGRAPDLRRTRHRAAQRRHRLPRARRRAGTLDRARRRRRVRDAAGRAGGRSSPSRARPVKAAGSNNEYLGHVMAGDPDGPGARDRGRGAARRAARPGWSIR